jgi:hypothetical protein
MTRKLARWSNLAALLVLVGASGRTEAGSIYTYTFATDFGNLGPPLSGSFKVDSSHIAASGNTDISTFITSLSFTIDGLTFTAPSLHPEGVTVTSAGDLTMGSGLNRFVGPDTTATFALLVRTGGMIGQDYDASSTTTGETEGTGIGHWTLLLGEPAPVPEPSSFILCGIGGLGLIAVLLRRRRNPV